MNEKGVGGGNPTGTNVSHVWTFYSIRGTNNYHPHFRLLIFVIRGGTRRLEKASLSKYDVFDVGTSPEHLQGPPESRTHLLLSQSFSSLNIWHFLFGMIYDRPPSRFHSWKRVPVLKSHRTRPTLLPHMPISDLSFPSPLSTALSTGLQVPSQFHYLSEACLLLCKDKPPHPQRRTCMGSGPGNSKPPGSGHQNLVEALRGV